MMKKLIFALALAAVLPLGGAGLPSNMRITANGDYDFVTEPGARYTLSLDNTFDSATVALQRKASDGNYYATGRSLAVAGQWDFRAPGYGMRLHVTGVASAASIVLTLANVPGKTSDDLITDLAADVSGVLPVANGGTGTATGSITATSALALAAGGSNQNVVLTPTGTGVVTTSKPLTITDSTASVGFTGPAALVVAGGIATNATSFMTNVVVPSSGIFQFNGQATLYSPGAAQVRLTVPAFNALSSLESLYLRWGSGTPEGAVTAPVGALYSRTDGGASTTLYVKQSGTGNTGWVAK